jgi:hypothetical protein
VTESDRVVFTENRASSEGGRQRLLAPRDYADTPERQTGIPENPLNL